MQEPLRAKAVCHLKYVDAITGAGGIPVIVPPYTDASMLDRVLEKLDGFCLIGGPDYDPSHYGGHQQPADEVMHSRRHQFDLALAEKLLQRKPLPLLGVCGGHQLINIALGGALVQDIRSEWKSPENQSTTLLHSDDERKGSTQEGAAYRHEVRISPATILERIVGASNVLTNSYHHQAVDPRRLGAGLKATAWAPDGVIEALESVEQDRFLLGIQWHPERQTDEPAHRAIFEALVSAARTAAK